MWDIASFFTPKKVSPGKYEGVGLVNIKKRLELQYDDKYKLEEKIMEKIYSLELLIPLEKKA